MLRKNTMTRFKESQNKEVDRGGQYQDMYGMKVLTI